MRVNYPSVGRVDARICDIDYTPYMVAGKKYPYYGGSYMNPPPDTVPENATPVLCTYGAVWYLSGYCTLAGSASITRQAITAFSDGAVGHPQGAVFVQFATGTTANSYAMLRWHVARLASADRPQYIHTWFTPFLAATNDYVLWELHTYTTAGYNYAGIRFVQGVGWQMFKPDSTWGTITGTPATYPSPLYIPVVIKLLPTNKYLKLTVGGKSWDLSNYNIRFTSGTYECYQTLKFEVHNTTTASSSANLYQIEWLEET